MADHVIPAEVRRFLLGRIDSIAQLEALLLLHREAEQLWDGPRLAARLYIGEPQAAEILRALCAESLIVNDGGRYRYADGDATQDQLIALVSAHYARHLIPVTNLIHDKPRRVQQFADAFKLKKDT